MIHYCHALVIKIDLDTNIYAYTRKDQVFKVTDLCKVGAITPIQLQLNWNVKGLKTTKLILFCNKVCFEYTKYGFANL